MAVQNRGPQLEGVVIALLATSWIFVSLRCYVRGILTKAFGVDDCFALLAVVSKL